jgi:glutamate 5-kinase
MAASETLIIKIGTQTLTKKNGTLNLPLMRDLVQQIVTLKKQGHRVILVSSGAVGTGRALVAKNPLKKIADPVNEKQILAAIGQAHLIQTYQKMLDKHGITAAQILLTKQDFVTKHHYQNIEHLFQSLRSQDKILPIVNENDSVAIQELMFTDNDELAGLLAAQLAADRLIILTNVDGVYDRVPSEIGAEIIPVMDPQGKKGAPFPSVSTEKSMAGRGGMLSKVNTARRMSNVGITMHIAAGYEPNIMVRLVQGETIGTTILPHKKISSVKRWLAAAPNERHQQAVAHVIANKTLADKLRDPDHVLSILPVGLIGIRGQFAKHDRVHVVDEKGHILAVGLARYDDATLKDRLGQQKQPVFLHTDTLYRTYEGSDS